MQNLLIIDPESDFLEWAQRHLSAGHVKVETAGSAEEGMKKFAALKPDLVIVEFQLKPLNGIELLKRLRQQDPQVMVVLCTAYPPTNAVIEAMKYGAFDFLRKESLTYDLRPVVESALRTREASRSEKPANDPWKRPYQYLRPGQHGEFDLYSLGADGKPGGEGGHR